jgi:endonuclease YncB( thermonuclease family)
MKRSHPALMFAALGCLQAAACQADYGLPSRPHQDIKVLDGDTLVFDGQWIRVRGIDAPELGPWAKCWAEAGLGGASRDVLEGAIHSEGPWRLVQPAQADERGMVVAGLANEDGEDLADFMVVYGYAASTDAHWDWCGLDANLHSPSEDEPRPHGPSLWWPSNNMFDERAGD